jgi:purine-binding chemotaxis protein CheW
MTAAAVRVGDRAATLRRAFDEAFTKPAAIGAGVLENLLAIGLRSHPYAMRAGDISGLFADKKITPLPSPVPALLGLAGFRGTVLPVYDLGLLLGHPRASAPRWLVVTVGAPVGLAFDAYDGQLQVAPDLIAPTLREAARKRHIHDVLHANGLRPIVHLPSVVASIESLLPGGSAKER